MGLDALGGLYLAYDLLGGQRGPLRTIARATGYMVLYFAGYASQLGPSLTIVIISVTMGVARAMESRGVEANTGQIGNDRGRMIRFGLVRGLVLGLAGITIGGPVFGAIFGLCSGIALAATYYLDNTPIEDNTGHIRPRISRRSLISSLMRALGISSAGLIAGLITSEGAHPVVLGLRLGLAAGTVTALVGLFGPSIEWWIENLPERRLGVIGLAMIFVGILLQSAQYWVVVFNVPVR